MVDKGDTINTIINNTDCIPKIEMEPNNQHHYRHQQYQQYQQHLI